TPGEAVEEHAHSEDRVTLPTGASRIPPAAPSSATTPPHAESASTNTAQTAVQKPEPKPATESTAEATLDSNAPAAAPEDEAPNSSEEVTKQFVPAEHGLTTGIPDQTARSKPPSSQRKNPKKKKKKFNYTSLPA